MVRIEESELDNALNISLLRDDMDQIWHIMNSDEKSVHNAMDPTLIQREKERAIRSQLNSANGDTAEIHDQFYRDHKLLIKLFQTLAVMPITRSAPGDKFSSSYKLRQIMPSTKFPLTGRITFSWNSSATYYAIVFYVFTTIIVLVVGYERVQILLTTRKFDEYIYAVVFIIFLIPHFWFVIIHQI